MKTPFSLLASLITAMAAMAQNEEIRIIDNFENSTPGVSLNLTETSGPNIPGKWYWQGGKEDPIIGAYNGNQFMQFPNEAMRSLSLSQTQFSNGRISFPSSNTNTLKFDLIWLHNIPGNEAMGVNVLFNTAETFANFSMPGIQGYCLRVSVVSAGMVSWELLQHSSEYETIVSGRQEVPGAINPDGETLPGNPVAVDLRWTGNTIRLAIASEEVFNSEKEPFKPLPQNEHLSEATYLSFFATGNRRKAIDNVEITSSTQP